MSLTIAPMATSAPARPANYFEHPAAALRYAVNRPAAHPQLLPLLLEAVREHLPVARALDVGCGTGNSTVALLPHARHIVGVDASSAMLAQAPLHPQIEYRKAHAEALPFRGGSFDLVTVCSAYHWFDHDRFLAEAARVLVPQGWLALYKIGSMGQVPELETFAAWKREVFRRRFPKVARNDETMDAAKAVGFGFELCAGESLRFAAAYDLDRYVANLLTHSSVIRVVDGGDVSIAAARAWLEDELAPFFAGGELTFEHTASMHVLRRTSAPPAGA